MTPTEQRFWERVSKNGNGCWEWLGGRFRDGYGRLHTAHSKAAHRFAYELAFGPIPEGLQIDHLCRNRGCVNPYHLDAVSNRVNWERGMSPSALLHRAGTCKYGHSLDDINVYVTPQGKRRCRECTKRHKRDSAARHGQLIS